MLFVIVLSVNVMISFAALSRVLVGYPNLHGVKRGLWD